MDKNSTHCDSVTMEVRTDKTAKPESSSRCQWKDRRKGTETEILKVPFKCWEELYYCERSALGQISKEGCGVSIHAGNSQTPTEHGAGSRELHKVISRGVV